MGILRAVLERRTLNDELGTHAGDVPLSLQSFLRERPFSGAATASGVTVTTANALQFGAVWACVRVISEDVASLPLPVYQRLSPRGKERARLHPLYRILHDQPNPEMNAMTFREMMTAHLLTWGNAYAYIVRDRSGQVLELWPLLPDRTTPGRDAKRNRIYETTLPSGEFVTLAQDQVLHVMGLGFDGQQGYSPIRMHAQAIGMGMAAQEFGSRFFGQGTHLGGVVQHPQRLSTQARTTLEKSLPEKYAGLGRAHLLLILEEGMTFNKLGIPPNEAQFIETRKFSVQEIARIFRVPPHKIQHLENATFSNIEHQGIEYVVDTLRPWLVRWEKAINTQLLGNQDHFFAEHIIEGLLRGDIASRYTAYATARQWGWLSADDVRELENQNPLPDGQGELYLVPMNMVPADRLSEVLGAIEGDTEETPADESDARNAEHRAALVRSAKSRRRIERAFIGLLKNEAVRVLARERVNVMQQAKKLFGQRLAGDFNDWLETFYEKSHRQFVLDRFLPLLLALARGVADVSAQEVNATLEALRIDLTAFMGAYAANVAINHVRTSKFRIRDVIRRAQEVEEDPVEALDAQFEAWQATRPAEIAEREALETGGAVAKAVWLAAGVIAMTWVSIGESCPYCEALNGRRVLIEGSFVPDGGEIPGGEGPFRPASKITHPPLHAGCDCLLVPG